MKYASHRHPKRRHESTTVDLSVGMLVAALFLTWAIAIGWLLLQALAFFGLE